MASLQKCNPYAIVLKMRIANYAALTNLKQDRAKSHKWDSVCVIIGIGGGFETAKIHQKN